MHCSRVDQVDLEGRLLASRFVLENIGFGWGCSKFPLVRSGWPVRTARGRKPLIERLRRALLDFVFFCYFFRIRMVFI